MDLDVLAYNEVQIGVKMFLTDTFVFDLSGVIYRIWWLPSMDCLHGVKTHSVHKVFSVFLPRKKYLCNV